MPTTTVLPKPILDRIKRSPAVYAGLRKARFGMGSVIGPRVITGIPGRCHPNDFMLDATDLASTQRYMAGAESFVDILGESLRAADRSWTDIGNTLEVGCGYGRIIRVLRRRQPSLPIFVNDFIDEGARFAASEFGATHIPPFERTPPDPSLSFDLVYLLSVYTHLDEPDIATSLAMLAAALAPGGILVFTTQGEYSAENCEQYEQYWLNKVELLDNLRSESFYYARYPHYRSNYGMTWMTPEKVEQIVKQAAPSLERINYDETRLDEHQDVYVYRKAT